MRRRFLGHLLNEVSIRTGVVVPRYRLWLALRERGYDPEWLTQRQTLEFCDLHLTAFLQEHGLGLSRRQLRSVRRALARHDPHLPTPEEWAHRYELD